MMTSLKIFEYILSQLFPTARHIEGGITEEGFWCAADLPHFVIEEGSLLLEEKFKNVVKNNSPIKTFEMMRENGVAFFRHRKEDQFAERVKGWTSNTIQIAELEGFAFPIFEGEIGKSTAEGGVVKILEVQKRGERVVFRVVVKENSQALKQWLKIWKGYEDNKTLAKALEIAEELRAGYFWKPKGVWLREKIKNNLNHVLEDTPYQLIKGSFPYTPTTVEYFLSTGGKKPLYLREWQEFEGGKQASSTNFYGMLDTTPFTRKILHAFVPSEQVVQELISSLQFFDKIFKIFGFEGEWSLAVERAAKAPSSRTEWDRAVKWLAGALEARGISITEKTRHPQAWITAEQGPILQAVVADKLDRKWLVASLGIDLSFSAELAKKGQTPPMVLLKGAAGESLERIIALLLERDQGILPWECTPEQVRVVSVGKQCVGYAEEIYARVVQEGFRAGINCTESKLGAKVHAAELERIPYLVVVGEREVKNGHITVRPYAAQEKVAPEGTYRIDEFIALLKRKSLRE